MNKTFALVTGGTRGIGLAIAKRLAGEGATLGLLYARDHEAATAAVAEIASVGGQAKVLACDLNDLAAIPQAAAQLEKECGGKFSLLVNNAGFIDDRFLLFSDDAHLEQILNVNLKAAISLCRYCSKAMIAKKQGVMVNVISPAAQRGRPGQTAYAAAKGGLLSFTKTLAAELGPLGIRVNALSPGIIDTDLVASLPENVRNDLINRVPMRRMGHVHEVAAACMLLIRATYMSGTVLAVDGGLT